MDVLFRTDNHIQGSDAFASEVEATVQDALRRFSERITRVEVHLNDENSHKGGDNDKRCMMEARVNGHQPIAVTCFAATNDQAIDGAATKLRTALERAFGRLNDRGGKTSASGEERV